VPDESLMPDSGSDPGDGTPAGTRTDDNGKDGAGEGQPSTDAGQRDSKDEKRIADTEAARKEKQAEFTRLSQNLAELREQLAEAKGQLSVLTAKPAEKDEPDWLESDEFSEKAADETPGKVLKGAIGKTRQEIVRLLEARDAHFNKKIADLEARLAQASPERQSVADVMEEFKDKAWFKAMPDAAKVQFAKETKAERAKAAEGEGGETRRSGSDSPNGSGRRVVRQKPSDGMSDEQKAYLKHVVEPLEKRDDTSLI